MKKDPNDYQPEGTKKCNRCGKRKRLGEYFPSRQKPNTQCIACTHEVREGADSRPPQKVPDKNYWGDNEIYQ